MSGQLRLILLSVALAFQCSTSAIAGASILDFIDGGHVNEVMASAEAGLDAISKQRLAEFLTGMTDLSDDLMNQGRNTGRQALLQAGNEINAEVEAARLQFGAEMDHQLSEASDQLRPFLVELQRWRVDFDQLLDEAISLEDSIAFDLERLPFAPDYFGLRRVAPTAVVEGLGPYRIGVTGDDFGSSIAGQTVVVSATFNGQQLDPPQPGGPHQVIFSIPETLVSGKFDEHKIVTLPLVISATRIRNDWLLGPLWPHPTSLKHHLEVSLLPDRVGTVSVITTRPVLSWVPEDPEVQTQAIHARTDFAFGPLGAAEIAGSQRFDGAPTATCGPIIRNAWQLLTGEVVLDTDPLIKEGYTTDRYVGEPEPPDWHDFNAAAYKRLGWDPNWGVALSCPHGTHCHLTPDQIKEHATPTTMPYEQCSLLRQIASNVTANGASVLVTIDGQATEDSLWTVSAPRSVYKQTDERADAPVILDVLATKWTEIVVPNEPDNSVGEVAFHRFNGQEIQGLLNADVGQLKRMDKRMVGADAHYYYQFDYGSKVFLPN